MPGGSGKLPGIFFAKRRAAGTGNGRRFAENCGNEAKKCGRTGINYS